MRPLALVIEDDKSIHLIYKYVLEKKGFDILWAMDGEQAIQLLNEYQPNIVFLDMLLPLVDGSIVLEHIRNSAHLQQSYIVIVSAHSRYESELDGLKGSFLLKPLQIPSIDNAIQRAFGSDYNNPANR